MRDNAGAAAIETGPAAEWEMEVKRKIRWNGILVAERNAFAKDRLGDSLLKMPCGRIGSIAWA